MTSDPSAFSQAETFLYGLIRSGVKLGLRNTQRLAAALGNPQNKLTCIHVAGTNGKGSVCTLIAAALQAAGMRVGLFTSPHLVSVRERLRVNGRAIEADDFSRLIDDIRQTAASLLAEEETRPTFFEFLTVMAFEYFYRCRVDVVIMEVGMGGRLDSTNILLPALTVITDIDFDHTAALGNTLDAIAGEKAGIIKPGVPLVCAASRAEARRRICRDAARQDAPVRVIGRDFEVLDHRPRPGPLPLQEQTIRVGKTEYLLCTRLIGPHQADNVATALAALECFRSFAPCLCSPETFSRSDPASHGAGAGLSLSAIERGMGRTIWPARLQRLANGLILDAAHNPSAVVMLVRTLQRFYPGETWPILFGVARDKDWQPMLKGLYPVCQCFYFVPIPNPRACPPAELAAFADQHFSSLPPVVVLENGEAGLASLLKQGRGLVAGSIFLAGEVLGILNGGRPVTLEAEG